MSREQVESLRKLGPAIDLRAQLSAVTKERDELREVIRATIAEVGECVFDRRYCITHGCKSPCWADALRAALQPGGSK